MLSWAFLYLGQKKKCVSGYISKKIRVGRSLLIFLYFFLKCYLFIRVGGETGNMHIFVFGLSTFKF